MINRLRKAGLLAVTAVVIAACDNDDRNTPQAPIPVPPAQATFDVTVTNLTNAQPMSPLAVIAHNFNYSAFAIGETATPGLEQMAEGGDNSGLLAEADAVQGVMITDSGAAPVPPGMSDTMSFTIDAANVGLTGVTVLTMLVNTNDAFSGLNSYPLANVAVGEEAVQYVVAYDAGTELNTELGTAIPGPVSGGEGFNAARDDRNNFVTMHAGVVSQDDGFMSSNLSQDHKFDNPVLRISIRRTQ